MLESHHLIGLDRITTLQKMVVQCTVVLGGLQPAILAELVLIRTSDSRGCLDSRYGYSGYRVSSPGIQNQLDFSSTNVFKVFSKLSTGNLAKAGTFLFQHLNLKHLYQKHNRNSFFYEKCNFHWYFSYMLFQKVFLLDKG